MGKYDPLRHFLENAAPDVDTMTVSFAQIEQILGDTLPYSARHYRPWRGNELRPGTHTQARSWLDAGWVVDTVDVGREWVRFRRMDGWDLVSGQATGPGDPGWRSYRASCTESAEGWAGTTRWRTGWEQRCYQGGRAVLSTDD
jgi:hypothetical protein